MKEYQMLRLAKVFFGVFFLVTCFALPVWAEGPEPRSARELTGLFAPDAPDVRRRIMQTGNGDCIGETVTPVCAIETFLACILRRDWRFCAIAQHKSLDDPDVLRPKGTISPTAYHIYRVHSVRRADRAAGQPPPDPTREPSALLIGIRDHVCYTDLQAQEETACELDPFTIFYTLVSDKSGWRIAKRHRLETR